MDKRKLAHEACKTFKNLNLRFLEKCFYKYFILKTKKNTQMSAFEVNIRFVGGFLAMHGLTNDSVSIFVNCV
jgi:hypothetical protein